MASARPIHWVYYDHAQHGEVRVAGFVLEVHARLFVSERAADAKRIAQADTSPAEAARIANGWGHLPPLNVKTEAA